MEKGSRTREAWRGVRECDRKLRAEFQGIEDGDLPTFRPRSYTGAGERTDLRARFSTLDDCTLREHLAMYRDTLGFTICRNATKAGV